MNHRRIQRYGWIRDHHDHRDLHYLLSRDEVMGIKPRSDLRSQFPECYDQGALGSCVGNGVAGVFQAALKRNGLSVYIPSRLFIYYHARVIEGTRREDAGAQIRDGIKVVTGLGACPETDWPYVVARFADEPTPKAHKDALKDVATQYMRVGQTNTLIRACLSADNPVVFGFEVFEAFESDAVAASGIVPMPRPSDRPIGGHCVVAVGHDDDKRQFLVRNSWGTKWGMDQGHFLFPYDYLMNTDLTSDLWTIKLIRQQK